MVESRESDGVLEGRGGVGPRAPCSAFASTVDDPVAFCASDWGAEGNQTPVESKGKKGDSQTWHLPAEQPVERAFGMAVQSSPLPSATHPPHCSTSAVSVGIKGREKARRTEVSSSCVSRHSYEAEGSCWTERPVEAPSIGHAVKPVGQSWRFSNDRFHPHPPPPPQPPPPLPFVGQIEHLPS